MVEFIASRLDDNGADEEEGGEHGAGFTRGGLCQHNFSIIDILGG